MDFPILMLDLSLFFGLYFQIFLLVTFFEVEEKETKNLANSAATIALLDPANRSKLPTVSIIVPCWNEARTVEKTVLSLLALDYPADKLSILVVDDGSTDDTFTVASALTRFKNVSVIHQENSGKYTAVNYGIANSTADLVGCLDADSTVDSQALIRMIPHFNDQKVMAVTPAMRTETNLPKPATLLQRIQRVEYNVGIFTKKVYAAIDAIHVTPGPFSVFRREIFEKIGPFKHAHNTEDMEIAFRIQSEGFRIANCHNAFVYTITPNTLNKLYRQRTRWTYGFLRNLIDYRRIVLNKKYGNLGMLTMPFAVLGILFTFYFTGLFIYHISSFIHTSYERFITVGFMAPHFSLAGTWNSFYFSLGMTTILGLLLFSTTLYIIFKSKKMAEGSMKPSRDILYFVCFYGFLAPIWIGKSVYNVVLSKKTPWR